jgi:hypothetical protein
MQVDCVICPNKIPLSVQFAKRDNTRFIDQALCPFFSRTPPEIRNEIFALALSRTCYIPKSRKPCIFALVLNRFRSKSRKPRIDTDLLLTCRRIYLETHLLPAAINEHVFCFFSGCTTAMADLKTYFECMTMEQRDAVANIHIITHMVWLECGLYRERDTNQVHEDH